MSVFEYILAFLTLVLGLGLARNLTAIAELEFTKRRAQDLSDLVWLVSITLLQIDFWFVSWSTSHDREVWELWRLLVTLSLAISLFMAGSYIGQASRLEGENRWRRLKFGMVALLTWLAVAVGNAIVVLDVELTVFPVIGGASILVALLSKSRVGLYRLGTFGFFAFSIYLLVVVGPTTIG